MYLFEELYALITSHPIASALAAFVIATYNLPQTLSKLRDRFVSFQNFYISVLISIFPSSKIWVNKKQNYIRKKLRALRVRESDIYPSRIPHSEINFYELFANDLSLAKKLIFNSGDGFNMDPAQNSDSFAKSCVKADYLDAAMIEALDNDKNKELIIFRFQIEAACNINWIGRLIAMKKFGGDRFRVFFDSTCDHVGCFCAIDPQDERDCVFEWQLVSGRKNIGNLAKGFGFTYRNKQICMKVLELFVGTPGGKKSDRLCKDNSGKEDENDKEWYQKIQGLQVDDLEAIQERLWRERASEYVESELVEIDGEKLRTYRWFDPELNEAYKKAVEDVQKKGGREEDLTSEDLIYSRDNFPEAAIPTISVAEIIEMNKS